MTLEADLEKLALQERTLQFKHFNPQTAWELGTRLKQLAEQKGISVAIDVYLGSATVFFYGMPGTTPDHADWIRRKRNVVLRFQRCSYAMGLTLQRDKSSLAVSHGLETRDYATHGGSFPIFVDGTGCVGAVTVSGVPQRQDHALVVEGLAGLLGHSLALLALEEEHERKIGFSKS